MALENSMYQNLLLFYFIDENLPYYLSIWGMINKLIKRSQFALDIAQMARLGDIIKYKIWKQSHLH